MSFRRMVGGLVKTPHIGTHWRILRDFRGFIRLHFLAAAVETGLLPALQQPRRLEDLLSPLGIQRPGMLESLLELGVALGHLGKAGGRYRLKSRDAKILAREDGDALAAMIQEFAAYHGPVYQNLADVLRGGERGDYLKGKGPLIARSSRVFEPLIGDFVKETVAARRPRHLLEVGCGSGVYLKYAHDGFPEVQGVALDLDPDVARQAQENLRRWGIDERFRVLCADVRRLPPEAEQRYDWISLYQNVYYFEPEERPGLYRRLAGLLHPGGVLGIISMMRGRTAASLDFDLVLQSTAGCAPLPELQETIEDLQASGFQRVERVRLMPGEPFYALLAETPAE